MTVSMNNASNMSTSVFSTGLAITLEDGFWMFLFSNVPSVLCSVFVLYHLIFDRTLRRALHNHVIIVVLVVNLIAELIDVPGMLSYFRLGVVWPQWPAYCKFWKYVDTVTYVLIAKLVAWASVERHILIFHDRWVSTKKKRFLLHYFPLSLIVVYCVLCYTITAFFIPCDLGFNYQFIYCGWYSCVNNNAAFSFYEFFTGAILNSLLIGVGSVALLGRVIRQKRLVRQRIQWRKHRKMAIQLLSITSIFLVLYLPPVLLSIANLLGVPSSVGADYRIYAFFFSNYVNFLLPFACVGTLPQLRVRLSNLFPHKRQRIAPTTLIMRPMKIIRTSIHTAQM